MDFRVWLIPLLLAAMLWVGCSRDASDTGYEAGHDLPLPNHSVEEMILLWDVFARVKLISKETTTIEWANTPDSNTWSAALELRFRVHEYLKGSGPNEIVAIVEEDEEHDSRTAAEARIEWLEAAYDSQYDDRQAIVILARPERLVGLSEDPSRFYLGQISRRGVDTYTLASHAGKNWLPEAPAGSASRGAPSDNKAAADRLFLLDVGPGAPSRGARTASNDPPNTIRLSTFKEWMATILAEARAGGTDDYWECVLLAYSVERRIRDEIRLNGSAGQTFLAQHHVRSARQDVHLGAHPRCADARRHRTPLVRGAGQGRRAVRRDPIPTEPGICRLPLVRTNHIDGSAAARR